MGPGTSHGTCLNKPKCMLGHLLVHFEVCDLTVNWTWHIPWHIPWQMSQHSKMHVGTSPGTFQGM
jgi:hypothetical protein